MEKITPLKALEEPTLKEVSFIRHGFFNRQGGVSEGCYASLNCAYASNDDPLRVRENRRRITSYFGYPPESLVTVKNIHSNRVMVVDRLWIEHEKPEADAMVTKQKDIMLGSDSADCPIILFADVKDGVIGLAHAGWRGAISGVIEMTVRQMEVLGAHLNNIVAAIGPCIAQASYEVQKEFYRRFINLNSTNQCYFQKSNKLNCYKFDLRGYVSDRLVCLGLKSINCVDIDTYSDEQFFSCRRSYHQGESDFGGHFSCIYMK